ncbi:MAG: branched-chain amino acid transaminase [Acidobacteria bacterium]|nr:branched-chain amino acid transaminase [Acidobacteriota bacterium]MCI0567743.1 branched-chain amino acid transaminase [Acidobacteriota bacterium]
MKKDGLLAYFKGQQVPLADAKVSVLTHAFLYGTAVFEGIRGYRSAAGGDVLIFRLREHYQRLERSCRILDMQPTHDVDSLCRLTVELVRANRFQEDIYIRPIAYKSAERIGVHLSEETEVVIVTVPFGKYLEDEKPISLGVSSWRRTEDNAIPGRAKVNGSYVNLALAASEARGAGFDEAILLNEDGHVSEAAGMNLFLVRDGRLITPGVSANLLEGVTRDSIRTLAVEELGVKVEERQVDRTELYVADEAFLVGTAAQVAPVGSIDRRVLGDGKPGPITARLKDLYGRVVRGQVSKYASWNTRVAG